MKFCILGFICSSCNDNMDFCFFSATLQSCHPSSAPRWCCIPWPPDSMTKMRRSSSSRSWTRRQIVMQTRFRSVPVPLTVQRRQTSAGFVNRWRSGTRLHGGSLGDGPIRASSFDARETTRGSSRSSRRRLIAVASVFVSRCVPLTGERKAGSRECVNLMRRRTRRHVDASIGNGEMGVSSMDSNEKVRNETLDSDLDAGQMSSSDKRKTKDTNREGIGQKGAKLGREDLARNLEKRLLQRLNNLLADRHLLQPGQKVLVAVSGGQDSIALIYLLAKLQSNWGWKLGVAHCDHQWSPSSRSQGSHVAQVASSLGLDYYQAVATRDVSGEGSARVWRYGILQRIAISHGYTAIVTAHTASDRVETLLNNLFRGSGLYGLQALTWKRYLSPRLSLSFSNGFTAEGIVESMDIPTEGQIAVGDYQVALIRPLLEARRTELREFCQLLELPLWPDPSNFCLDIGRNRIRHQLLPYLRRNFQSEIDKALTRWAEILHGEQSFLESLCEDIRAKAESPLPFEEGGKKLDTALLQSLPVALQRRVIKQFVETFTGRSLSFDHVERLRVMSLVRAETGGSRISLPGRVEVIFLDKELHLVGIRPQHGKELENFVDRPLKM